MLETLTNNITDVEQYYNKSFCIEKNSEKRTGITCPVIIDDVDVDSKDDVVKKKLERIQKQVTAEFNNAGIEENGHPEMDRLFDQLFEFQASDEVIENARNEIEALKMTNLQKKNLQNCIQEMVKIITNRWEIGGLFIPIGSGKYEIHIYYETFREWAKNDEDLALELCKYVMAHEMYHALHYAEVMTESGRWIYTKKDYLKQVAVQETLAEYFGLCYSKDCIDDDGSRVEKYIKSQRNIDSFSENDGYSGALILEKCELSNGSKGKGNPVYQTVYNISLSDMPKAYRQIPVGR